MLKKADQIVNHYFNEGDAGWSACSGLRSALYQVIQEYTENESPNKPLKCENHDASPGFCSCGGSHLEFECPYEYSAT